MAPIRIGVLGAARIVPAAILKPCSKNPGAVVSAIAGRDAVRTSAFARSNGIPRVFASYGELVGSGDIDAVYVALPNGLHAEWSVKAMEAGKHVLCEKPLASNEREALAILAARDRAGTVFMDAFHYRYHPMYEAIEETVRGGALGRVLSASASFMIPRMALTDIRFSYALAGGSLMDPTCYPVNALLALLGSEPSITEARMKLSFPEIDRAVRAVLEFPGGVRGGIAGSLRAFAVPGARLSIRGEKGGLEARSPFQPRNGGALATRIAGRRTVRNFDSLELETYDYQLGAFLAAIRKGAPFPTTAEEGVAYMRVIDAIYRKAGSKPRGD